MARNRRRGNGGGRGRNRGSGLYARPISEPCNFVEVDVAVTNSTNVLTHAQVAAALTAVIPVASISKYRLSSLVIDPIVSDVSIVNTVVQMGISGLEYLNSNSQKPLRIRLGKDYGDDGMWLVTDGSALTDGALPGNEVTTDNSVIINIPAVVSAWSTTLHLRFAWQDPS